MMSTPSLRPQSAIIEPTCPSPTMPRVIRCQSSGRRVNMEAHTYWATAGALQPGAETTRMPLSAHQGRSIWSVPMVAVATRRTCEPPSNAALQRVRVRTRTAHASLTVSGVISPGERRKTCAAPARNPSGINGMCDSIMIFGCDIAG